MSELKLTKSETRILTDAAGRGGEVVLPQSMKPVTAERLIGKFRAHDLIEAASDAEGHRLTRSGYRAIGLRRPRLSRPETNEGEDTSAAARPGKRQLVLDLLKRPEGASLAELVATTGWLAHTTRAAISRLRKDGQAITKVPRPDGVGAYVIMPELKLRRDRSRVTALAA